MFDAVEIKLARTEYFLQNLRDLKQYVYNFGTVSNKKEVAFRANLDAFFFEIISAKDCFLQGIVSHYNLTINQKLVGKRGLENLASKLKELNLTDASEVVEEIKEKLYHKLSYEQKVRDDDDSWLWRLNEYRNSVTHREVLREVRRIKLPRPQGEENRRVFLQFPGQNMEPPAGIQKVEVPEDHLGVCLYNDPEKLSGTADIEIIEYCEQSLLRMRGFLQKKYSNLQIV